HVSGRAAQHADLARIGEVKSHQQADAGGFPRSIRPKKSADLARAGLERHRGERGDGLAPERAAVDLGDVLELNGCRHWPLPGGENSGIQDTSPGYIPRPYR